MDDSGNNCIIFVLGVTSANDSLFTYEEGKNHSSHVVAEYVPIFLDQANLTFENATLGQEAKDMCGDNIHTTGKFSIGDATKQALELYAADINDTQTPGKLCAKLGKG